jgi:hypothetical protein
MTAGQPSRNPATVARPDHRDRREPPALPALIAAILLTIVPKKASSLERA